MMTWDVYVADLKSNESIDEAAIFSREGCKWAASPGFSSVTPEQIKVLVGDVEPLRMCGPTLGKTKYMFLRDEKTENNTLLLKAKDRNVCVCLTKTAVLITEGPAMTAGKQNVKTCHVAEYLILAGF